MQSERGIKMKIKKLWLMVLTMVFAVMLSTLAYCDTSGKCGDNVTWTLTDEGKLTISGTGDMYTSTPWYNYRTSIKTVIIEDGVTSIGNSAFVNCTNLTSVNIPNGVTSIEIDAFYGCKGLTSVEIPDSVTSIGGGAFSYCTGLTSVNIPNGVTSIGSYTFYSCTGLTSVNIPSGVTTIGGSAFYGCTGLTSIEIPSSVTSIGEGVFSDCKGLTSIEIPSSVTTIERSAFNSCKGLTSVEIPSSVTSIGDRAFKWCDSLTSIEIPSSVTSIGSQTFYGCAKLNTYYHTAGATITAANLSTAGAPTGIKEVIIPDTETDISVGTLTGKLENGVTFDVKVDTSKFGGDETTPYLDEVCVIINDKDEDGSGNGYKITDCYEEDNYIVFPVQIKVDSKDITSLAIRAEVYARPNQVPEGDITYYASSVSKVA
jgi:hypothetical protein